MTPGVTLQTVPANGIEFQVATAGEGPVLVLLHGFPHTWLLWSALIPRLAGDHRLVAPDLRGLGGSTRAVGGYDAISLSEDVEALLDALDVETADVAAIDCAVASAFVLALRRPHRVRRLILMEATLGKLPGAEDFWATDPWWFGFQAVPGLADTVLAGHEGEYLDFFYQTGTHSGLGIDPEVREEFVAAYRGPESLRCAFEYYRAMPEWGRQLNELLAQSRLRVPTMAVGAHPVGDGLRRQLEPFTDNLRGELISECGHLIPLDRPDSAATLFSSFLSG